MAVWLLNAGMSAAARPTEYDEDRCEQVRTAPKGATLVHDEDRDAGHSGRPHVVVAWTLLLGAARERVSRASREPTAVAQRRSQERLVDQLPVLLQARALSINRLAQLVGVSQSHLSRVVRSADRKSISGDLAERIAVAMDLPDDWFPETRRERVLERVRSDQAFCDRLYDELVAK